jgi:hypothetical protein
MGLQLAAGPAKCTTRNIRGKKREQERNWILRDGEDASVKSKISHA